MKKLIIAALLMLSCPFVTGQTTIVNGTVRDLTNAAVTSGQVTFSLRPGLDTTISGSARFTPNTVTCSITGTGAVKALDGVSNCVVANNTSLTPSGTSYTVCIQPGFVTPGSCFNFYALGTTTDISGIVPTPTTSPAFTFVDLFSAQTIAGNKTFTGNTTFNGSLTLGALHVASLINAGTETIAGTLGVTGISTLSGGVSTPKIDNVLWVDGTTYTTIAACYAAISAGGTCMLPPGYTETLSANLVLNKKNTTIQAMGSCTVTLGAFNVQVSQGTDNVSIISPYAHSSDQGGNTQGCAFIGYTGAGAAIDVGSSAGFTYNTLIRGIQVSLSVASANAIAVRLTNEVLGALDDDACVQGPVSGQKCFATVGTGAFFAGLIRILSPECNAALGVTNNFCIQFGAISNDNTIIGGHANILGSGANGSVCIDVSGVTSANNYVIGFDCDTGVTAVTVESTVNGGLKGVVNVDSGVTNIANFGAGSFGNSITTNGNLPYVNNGVSGTNSVVNPARFNILSDVWQLSEAAGSLLWNDRADGTSRLIMTQGPGGRSGLNGPSGGGILTFNTDSGTGGEQFGNGAATTRDIDANGTLHPHVAGAVGVGTAALPEKDFFFGTAATNNFHFVPGATAAAITVNVSSPISPTTVGLPFTIGSGTAAMTTAGITTGACGTTVTVAATGVLTTDVISFSRNAAATIGNGGGLTLNAWPTAGSVNFNYCNSAAGTITPTAMTINWTVVR